MAWRKLNQELLGRHWFLVLKSGLLEAREGESCCCDDGQRQGIFTHHDDWLLMPDKRDGMQESLRYGSRCRLLALRDAGNPS